MFDKTSMKHLVLCSAVVLSVLPMALQSQQARPRVQLITSVGSYLPIGDLGYGQGPGAEAAEAPELLGLGRGLTVGLTAESFVRPALGIRAGVKYGFGGQLRAADMGYESCGPNCGMATYDWAQVTDASALLLNADLVVRPAPAAWRLQPYLLGGIGYRHHYYDREAVPSGQAAVQAEDQRSRRVPHIGLGAAWLARSLTFRLEADFYGSLRDHYNDGAVSLGVGWSPSWAR